MNTAMKRKPVTTQAMWELAYEDFSYADMMARLAREDTETPKDILDRREAVARIRKAMLNAMDFLITNDADIAAVLDRKGKASS